MSIEQYTIQKHSYEWIYQTEARAILGTTSERTAIMGIVGVVETRFGKPRKNKITYLYSRTSVIEFARKERSEQDAEILKACLAGRDFRSLEITVPSAEEPFYLLKDFGPSFGFPVECFAEVLRDGSGRDSTVWKKGETRIRRREMKLIKKVVVHDEISEVWFRYLMWRLTKCPSNGACPLSLEQLDFWDEE